eukprot:GHVQ01004774.1.p1 GENE.GHVQ01004774.1~~GHVQ01004774.1.p1  ORF type:complete len:219 (+),score=25.47 GHVQ01004774.1:481-1137(+)
MYLVGRKQETLNSVAEECRTLGASKVDVFTTDLSDASATKQLALTLLSPQYDSYGVDVIINNAGALVNGSADSGAVDDWAANLNTNLLAPMILTRLLSDKMVSRETGVIINIGSIAAIEGMQGEGLYSATKFGLRGWSQHCYRKLRYNNIKVMLINPAFVATEMVLGDGQQPTRLIAERMLQPEDVAEVAMLPFRTSSSCCPEEVTMRLTLSPFREDK